jgi:hypothetical protein
MSALLTIPVAISVGDTSTYLASNDISVGALYGQRISSPTSPLTIAMATDSVRWQYSGNPADPTLRGTTNYLIWLCGNYGLKAQYIISGQGGGSVIPVTPNNLPIPIQFVVTNSSFMVDGQSSTTVGSFIGFNLLFIRNNIPQSTVNTGVGSYYTWDRNTGLFTCSPAATGYPTVPLQSAELFQFYAIS